MKYIQPVTLQTNTYSFQKKMYTVIQWIKCRRIKKTNTLNTSSLALRESIVGFQNDHQSVSLSDVLYVLVIEISVRIIPGRWQQSQLRNNHGYRITLENRNTLIKSGNIGQRGCHSLLKRVHFEYDLRFSSSGRWVLSVYSVGRTEKKNPWLGLDWNQDPSENRSAKPFPEISRAPTSIKTREHVHDGQHLYDCNSLSVSLAMIGPYHVE